MLLPISPTDTPKNAVIALGNFDGVHLGHQQVLDTAKALAKKLTTTAGAVTFTPHPRRYFQPGLPPFRLCSDSQRCQYFKQADLAFTLLLKFDESLATLPAATFIKDILVDQLAVKGVVVGYDFLFGHERRGNTKLLQALAEKHGFSLVIVNPSYDDAGLLYSSSRIRQHLRDGDLIAANNALGRPWSIHGSVEYGAQKGRTIGFPTANIAWGDYVVPKYGVYAVTGTLPDGQYVEGVANIGIRPTVNGKQQNLEVHWFNLPADSNLYEQQLTVNLHHFIRPEQKFDTFDALKQQIEHDCEAARHALQEHHGDDPSKNSNRHSNIA